MKIDRLSDKLLAAARALPSSDAVPYAFEKRIMAAVASQTPVDIWALWSRSLWRAAAPCVAIMLAVSVWAVVESSKTSTSSTLAADFDQTVWGPLISLNDTW